MIGKEKRALERATPKVRARNSIKEWMVIVRKKSGCSSVPWIDGSFHSQKIEIRRAVRVSLKNPEINDEIKRIYFKLKAITCIFRISPLFALILLLPLALLLSSIVHSIVV